MRELIRANYALDPAQTSQLDRRVGYLKAAARRLGRLDWLNIVVAAIVQLVFQSVLSSDAAQEVSSFIQQALGDLFTFLKDVPQLPPT